MAAQEHGVTALEFEKVAGARIAIDSIRNKLQHAQGWAVPIVCDLIVDELAELAPVLAAVTAGYLFASMRSGDDQTFMQAELLKDALLDALPVSIRGGV